MGAAAGRPALTFSRWAALTICTAGSSSLESSAAGIVPASTQDMSKLPAPMTELPETELAIDMSGDGEARLLRPPLPRRRPREASSPLPTPGRPKSHVDVGAR